MVKWYIHTLQHKALVLWYITQFCGQLMWRGITHDNSKFSKEEATLFASLRPKLASTDYGTPEYKKLLRQLGPALEHHYLNRHHPEAHKNGVNGMNFLDLIEMWHDWRAATQKHSDVNIKISIDQNTGRFNLSEQLTDIMKNSV